MSSIPFMPLWVGDFLLKTSDLDARETGAYMLLLMAMWSRDGSLPADQKKLQRVAKCGREWPAVWASIGHYFNETDGRISQDRLTEELQKARAKREVNQHNGGLGGRAKALKSNDAALANASHSLKQSYPETESKKEIGKPISRVPDGFDEFWEASPRKVAKDKARPAYVKALRKTDARTLIAAMRRYAESRIGEDPQYTAHAATWLNAGRWKDEPDPPKPLQITGGNHGQTDRRQFDAAITETARRLSQGTISLDHSSRDPFAAQ